MKQFFKCYLNGFTIIELMATITITTSIFLGMSYIFIESGKFYKRQFVFEDINRYANNALDIILDDIKTSTSTLLFGQNNGDCLIVTNTVDEDNNPILHTYFVDEEKGIMLNNLDEPILKFYPGTDQNYALTIASFDCNIINDPGLSTELSGSIYDFELILKYQYNLREEEKDKFLSYTRRLFSSTDFIISKQN